MAGKKYYVFSTLSSDMNYTNYVEGGADIPIALPFVHVKGGAGVANDRLITPRGVMTEIDEEQLDYLRANKVFQLHEENGHMKVEDAAHDADKVVADMEGRDTSAPIVPQDDVAPGGVVTVVGGEEQEAAPAAPRTGKRRG